MSSSLLLSPYAPPTPPILRIPTLAVPVVQNTSSFRNSIKINISDYPKLKDETQWRTFNRLLRATAASHDTLDVLDTTYLPSQEDKLSFKDKQRFMYHVFSNIILTTKGKNCVRQRADTLDAQAVYADLLDTYHDHLSSTLTATRIRQELTLMKLDDKWRKSFESFFHLWTSKIQDLESIEDKLIDDDTNRIWLTNILASQPEMDAAIG